ncbi:hypothetical protein TNCV_534521 [Trichonephila clavipes]|nr:hypothetical protein TNCV_534521 [Trichonephila clavipes]
MPLGGNIFSWNRSSRCLEGMITDDHYRSILSDPLPPMFQTLFPGKRLEFPYDNAPVHTSRCVQTQLNEHDDKVEHLTWCPQHLISTSLSVGGDFYFSVPSFEHTI